MSVFRVLPVAVLFSVGLLSGAKASGVVFSDQYESCVAETGWTPEEVGKCIIAETALWDKRLNVVYKAVSDQMNEERRKNLLAAQRLWIKFRDANCIVAATDQGEQGKIEKLTCLMMMTADRAAELQTYLDGADDEAPGEAAIEAIAGFEHEKDLVERLRDAIGNETFKGGIIAAMPMKWLDGRGAAVLFSGARAQRYLMIETISEKGGVCSIEGLVGVGADGIARIVADSCEVSLSPITNNRMTLNAAESCKSYCGGTANIGGVFELGENVVFKK